MGREENGDLGIAKSGVTIFQSHGGFCFYVREGTVGLVRRDGLGTLRCVLILTQQVGQRSCLNVGRYISNPSS